MKRVVIGLAALLAFGAARLPLEIHLDRLQRATGFRATSLDLPLREQVGQMGFVAALSGFRSLVAAVLWIEAHSAWEKVEWGRMAGLLSTVTTLQPKSILYWDMSGWHMAYNASQAALDDKKRQPSAILRQRAQQQYFDLGKKFYLDGLRSNPDSGALWENFAILERDKFQDHAAAAHAFAEAATKPDARPYERRFAAYELAQIPGREREAYEKLKALYDEGPTQRYPSLIHDIKVLEEKLGIPADQRIMDSEPGSAH
jgi:hypothetical protein